MSKRIDDIELLRAIAILSVVIEHADRNLITWHSRSFETILLIWRGWSGVDLFFAVSGFVIARDLLPKLEESIKQDTYWRTTLAFWLRRAWRLLPSAWLWLAIILLCALTYNHSGVFRSVKSALDGTIAAVLQYANLRFAHCFALTDCGANFYYWSLSLEEQFYLLLPLLFFLSRKWLPYILACLVLFQLATPHRSILMANIRSDALMFGVLIAIWSQTASYRLCEPRFLARSALARLIVLIGLLLMMGIATAAFEDWRFTPYRFSIISTIAATLVWIASYNKDYLLAAKPLKPLMLWIGARSYAIYLIHPVIYALIIETWYRLSPQGTIFNPAHTIPFVLTATLSILLLCDLNYRLIEMPARKFGMRVAERFAMEHSQTCTK